MTIPVREVIEECRAREILCIVDGAHAPGQIDLNLDDLDPDIYVGNCHKWLMAPKGAGFLYVREELHEMIEPLAVSWGRHSHSPTQFVREMEYSGTMNIASFLAVADCVDFLQRHDWDSVRKKCSVLRNEAERRVMEITGPALLVWRVRGLLSTNGDDGTAGGNRSGRIETSALR